MSGWAQRDAERAEDEANDSEEMRTEIKELCAENGRLRGWFAWRAAWAGADGPHLKDGTPWYIAAARGDKAP